MKNTRLIDTSPLGDCLFDGARDYDREINFESVDRDLDLEKIIYLDSRTIFLNETNSINHDRPNYRPYNIILGDEIRVRKTDKGVFEAHFTSINEHFCEIIRCDVGYYRFDEDIFGLDLSPIFVQFLMNI